MNEPRLYLKILGGEEKHPASRVFRPNETLSWECRLEGLTMADIQAVENSVLWYTEGKGEEDLSVHFFDRHVAGEPERFDLSLPRQLQTTLPVTPLSYAGVIVKVRWCVRSTARK